MNNRNAKGQFFRGFTPWNKGKKLHYVGHNQPHTQKSRHKMSLALKGKKAWNKGKPMSEKTRRKLSIANKGKFLSPEHREKIMLAMQKFRGENNSNWKGGRTERHKYILVTCPPEFKVMAKKDGYILEHRLVMAKFIGRPLLKGEVVDHKNTDTRDNRPENLKLYQSNAKHLSETLRKNSPQDLLRQKKK